MDEAEWRRTHADPDHLRWTAGELRSRAEALERAYARLCREVRGARWWGVAASRFREEVQGYYDGQHSARRALESAADALLSTAWRLDQDLERVRREERERRGW